jgi:hypothetical protein
MPAALPARVAPSANPGTMSRPGQPASRGVRQGRCGARHPGRALCQSPAFSASAGTSWSSESARSHCGHGRQTGVELREPLGRQAYVGHGERAGAPQWRSPRSAPRRPRRTPGSPRAGRHWPRQALDVPAEHCVNPHLAVVQPGLRGPRRRGDRIAATGRRPIRPGGRGGPPAARPALSFRRARAGHDGGRLDQPPAVLAAHRARHGRRHAHQVGRPPSAATSPRRPGSCTVPIPTSPWCSRGFVDRGACGICGDRNGQRRRASRTSRSPSSCRPWRSPRSATRRTPGSPRAGRCHRARADPPAAVRRDMPTSHRPVLCANPPPSPWCCLGLVDHGVRRTQADAKPVRAVRPASTLRSACRGPGRTGWPCRPPS